jgi:hypothetical protein
MKRLWELVGGQDTLMHDSADAADARARSLVSHDLYDLDENTNTGLQRAMQRIIASRDLSELLLTAMARNHTLLTAAMVCKAWAMAVSTDFWREQLRDILVVRDLAAADTYGQGISFFHPPSTSELDVHGMELQQQHVRQVRTMIAGVIVKATLPPGTIRSCMLGRVELVNGVVFAVWQETVQVRLMDEETLQMGAWMTVETLDSSAWPPWMAASVLQAPAERWRSICVTPEGVAWDGPVLQDPPL